MNKFDLILLNDIQSFAAKGKNKLYAKKGERVRLISRNMPVLIVENGKGDRFPILHDDAKEIPV